MPIHKRATEAELTELMKVNKGGSLTHYRRRYEAMTQGRKAKEDNKNAFQFEEILKENMEAYR